MVKGAVKQAATRRRSKRVAKMTKKVAKRGKGLAEKAANAVTGIGTFFQKAKPGAKKSKKRAAGSKSKASGKDAKRSKLADISNADGKAPAARRSRSSAAPNPMVAASSASAPTAVIPSTMSDDDQTTASVPAASPAIFVGPPAVPAGCVDIDTRRVGEPTECTEYICDIISNMKEAECDRGININYMNSDHSTHVQSDINPGMRTILVDWLVEVAEEYRLHHETLFLCVDLIDKSLSKFDVPRSQLQLLGCACMLLAAKYEEIWPPTVDDFVYISDNTYTREEVLKMEQTVLKELKFCITFPTMKHFLNRLIEASVQPAEYTGTTDQHTISAAATVRAAHTNGGKCDYANDGTWSQPTALLNYARTRGIGYCKEQVESPETIEKKNKEVKMTHYLSELALLHFDMLKFSPSLKASSAIYLARATLSTERPDKYWNATLQHYSGFSEEELKECVKALHGHHKTAEKAKLQAIREKYSHTKTCQVGKVEALGALPW